MKMEDSIGTPRVRKKKEKEKKKKKKEGKKGGGTEGHGGSKNDIDSGNVFLAARCVFVYCQWQQISCLISH